MENRKFVVGDTVIASQRDDNPYGITTCGYIAKVWGVNSNGTIILVDSNEHRGDSTENGHRGYWVESMYFELYKPAVEIGVSTCEHCGCVIETDEYTLLDDGTVYCKDCAENELNTCDFCGKKHLRDNMTFVDDNLLCERCLHENYTRCADCNEWVDNEDMVYTSHGEYVCSDCINSHYYQCCDCEEWVHEDCVCWEDNEPYCESCYEEMREERDRAIHDYGYKPEPIFYGDDDPLYMGVELEIDKGGEYNENARAILDIANAENETIYCKHDGSLNRGFEIVSHPCTLEYHTKDMLWRETMTKALSMKYRSHDTDTCGLHIHVSRTALGDNWDEREDTISRIVYFIEHHWHEVLRFTRRSEERMERWASRYGLLENAEETYKNAKDRYDRYRCINLQNEYTVEFRMFRGTLKYDTFLATLQFVHEVCKQCTELTTKEVEKLSWEDFISKIDGEAKPELIEYLKNREIGIEDSESEDE
jgi:hypothetical protein